MSSFSGQAQAGGGFGVPVGFDMENPSSTERRMIARAFDATEIELVNAVLNGSSTPSVTFELRFGPDRSGAGTEILTSGRTVTSTTTGTDFTPDVTTIPAGSYVWMLTTAQSGTVVELFITLKRKG